MRDKIVALLRAEGQLRRLDAATMASVASFFMRHVETNLETTARRHPLGFVVISEPVCEGLVLRYHIWPRDWGVPDGQESGQTHDHSFELNSLVLGGSLRQLTFEAVIASSGGHEIFEVHYGAEVGSDLRRTGQRARLERETDETFAAATAYRLPPRVVHYVETVRRPAATLVLSVAYPGAPAPRVFVPLGQKAPGAFPREILDPKEIAIARSAIAELREITSQ